MFDILTKFILAQPQNWRCKNEEARSNQLIFGTFLLISCFCYKSVQDLDLNLLVVETV